MKLKSIAAILVAGIMVVSLPMVAMASSHVALDINKSGEYDAVDTTKLVGVSLSGSTSKVNNVTASVNDGANGSVNVNVADGGYIAGAIFDSSADNNELTLKGDVNVTVSQSTTDSDVYGVNNCVGNNNKMIVEGNVRVSDSSVSKDTVYGVMNDSVLIQTQNVTVEANTGKDVYGVYQSSGEVKSKDIKVTNAGEGATYGIYANGGSTVTEGNIESTGTAVWANSNSTVTVTGDLSAGDAGIFGYDNAENAKVLVKGNIVKADTGIDLANPGEKSIYEVDGNIVASDSGIYGRGNDVVIVTGTISGNDNPIMFDKTENIYVGKFELKNGDVATYENSDEDGNSITNINYIIKNASSVGSFTLSSASGKAGTVTGLDGTVYQTAKEASADTSDIKINVAVVDGYTFKSFAGDSAAYVKDNGDGTYTLIVPRGGGVSLDLVYEAIQQSSGSSAWSSAPTVKGSASAPISNGTWTNVNGAFRYEVNGETLKNTKAWITYVPAGQTTPVTGCFYFDRNGSMQTGWQKIDDVWYYFNTAQGPTYGMMLTNTTTPDGYVVDADGKYVEAK